MRALTIHDVNPDPFKAESPLQGLCFGKSPKYIRVDAAHNFAIEGIGKDFLASSIVLLVRMGHFGDGPNARRFGCAFLRFLDYCRAHKKNTTIPDFSSSTLKLPENSWLASVLVT